MRTLTPLQAVAASALLLVGCAAPTGAGPNLLGAAAELATWMTGSFDSADQAAEAPEDFLDIRLEMVPIWTERADGPWLYIEQASATALERPYRQRIYKLTREGGQLRSDVFELPGEPLALAGAWRSPSAFDGLEPGDLLPREGCSIWLRREGSAWVGSTRGDACSSTLAGASYATSEVTVTDDLLTSWDRGFDADGEQVWGAEAGPYRFVKRR